MRSATPGCRSPGCRNIWAAPAQASPTALRFWASPGVSRWRCRSPRRCSPAGCWRAPASKRRPAPMTVAPGAAARPHHARRRRHARAAARAACRLRRMRSTSPCSPIAATSRRSRWSRRKTAGCGDGRNLAGDAVNAVTFERVKPLRVAPAPAGFDRDALLLMGAAVRSVQIAGALEAILRLSVAYANERVAFERPIGKFQAVQQNLARLAGEVAAALAAAGSAADTIAQRRRVRRRRVAGSRLRQDPLPARRRRKARPSRIRCSAPSASPRSTCCIASRCACSAWRDDFGNESYWAAELGRHDRARAAPTSSGPCWRRGDDRMSTDLHFDPIRLPPECEALRAGGARVPRRGDRGRHFRSAPAAAMATRTTANSAAASAPRAGSA